MQKKELDFSNLNESSLNTVNELHALFPHWKRISVLKKIKKTLKGEDLRFVAKADGKIIAHMKVMIGKGIHKHRAEMTSLIVHPGHRKKGLGLGLVKFTLKNVPDKINLVILSVDRKNKAAISLYKKAGFTSYGMLKGASFVKGKFTDNYLMQKRI
ncbi:MAG: GNAT family N-acetyltransferase [archaeon]